MAGFEAFRASVKCLDYEQSTRIRDRFISEFIDQGDPLFDESILQRHDFPDGKAYTGYLWDFIGARALVSEGELWARVTRREWIYAMWDIHSSNRILIKDYWRFPKNSILVGQPPELIREGQAYLPEDLYLFDDSYAWVAATTHDEIDGERFCLWAGAPYVT
jgi:hypothetical protein